jgi:probable HAF family extracellular repeat protein
MTQYAFKISNVGDGDRILATEWFDVNNKGERVGTCWGMQPISAIYHKGSGSSITAFSYEKHETNSHGLNDQGMIVGRNVRQLWPGRIEGFSIPSINQANLPTFIPGPKNAYGTEIFAVNEKQVMVGLYAYPPPGDGLTIIQMFIYHGGNYTLLGEPSTEFSHPFGINDHGEVVGGRTEKGVRRAFIYKKGAFTYLTVPGAGNTSAYDINNHGHIVGWYDDENERVIHGFLFADGKFTTVDFPDASATYIYGINDSGMIVGGYRKKDANSVNGFVATPTTVATEPEMEVLQIEQHFEF